jgi:hypothetical protein
MGVDRRPAAGRQQMACAGEEWQKLRSLDCLQKYFHHHIRVVDIVREQ